MNLKGKILIAAVLVMIPFTGAKASLIGPELVINGSFERPDISPGLTIGFPGIPGWHRTDPITCGIRVMRTSSAYDGDQVVRLDSGCNTGMGQYLETTQMSDYLISFAYSPYPGIPADSNEIETYWDGDLIGTITAEGVGLIGPDWIEVTYDVTASRPSPLLEFRASGTSDGRGGLIDFVSVRRVPEPATMLLMGSGLIGFIGYGLRRKKQTA